MKERLKKLRKELKLSQDRFAEKIFLTGRALANYESGFRQPDNMTIAMICNVETIAQKLQTANDETKIKAIYFIEGLLAQEKMITVSPPTPGNEGACCHGEDR